MGATVSTGKLVGAFQGSNGTTTYVLFEETFEKNCYPHSPKWSARAIGDLNAALRVIFLSGSSCEGGMLKGAGGRDITPEGYIAGWMKEMESPVEMTDRAFELTVGDSWQSPIAISDFERVKAKLVAIGANKIAATLEMGETAQASLYADSEALSAIYDGIEIGAWRIIQSYDTPLHGTRNPNLGYKPAKAKAYALNVPRFMKIRADFDHHLIQGADGIWRCEGAGYSYVSSYVANLWQDELRNPGSYRNRIKTYRDAIKHASVAPAQSTKIVVDTMADLDQWQRDSVERIIRDTPHARVGYEVHMSIPSDYNQLYWVSGLPEKCTKWVITDNAPTEQLSLLAS